MPSSITLTVSHLPTSTSFFLSALQPLGYVFRGRQEHTIGFGPAFPSNTPADFWITQEIPGVPAGAAHVAFPRCISHAGPGFLRCRPESWWEDSWRTMPAGCNGLLLSSGDRLDGNSIEAVHRPGINDEANKENVDARSMVSHRSGSMKAPSAAASAAPKTVVSQARSKAPSYVSSASTRTPEKTQPKPKPSGDVLDTLINEARSAANVARDVVNNFKGNVSSKPPATGNKPSTGGGGEAIVGTLLGVAAGAALHYAFSNRANDSDDDDRKEYEFQPRRPSVVGRSNTGPAAVMRPEYSTTHSEYRGTYAGHQRAIEPAPSAYTYASRSNDGQRLITMHDRDTPAPTAVNLRTSPKSDYASTNRPNSARRMSIDSGFGPGPRDLELASHASSKASGHSKKSVNVPPPTSYRAPTALTVKSKASEGSQSRANSLSRIGRSHSGRSATGEQPRSRSHSRQSSSSRRGRRDDFDAIQGELEEAKTVFHVTESMHRTTSHPNSTPSSKNGSKAPSRASSKHSRKDPAEYPLPPSRAATWAGSEGGKSSFVSARSNHGPNGRVDAPRTIIGRLNPLRSVEKADTASVVSKQKELRNLDVTDREVAPDDSVSQISVESRRSRRSKTSSRR